MSRNLLKIRAMKEMEDRRKSEETYTMPLTKAPDMKDFLKEFYKNAYAADRKEFYLRERETYPNSVGRLYTELCCGNPKIVSFEDFWQRYEYRCGDLDRIIRELSEKDAAAAAKRQEEAARKRSGDDSSGANNFWNNMRTTINNAADSLDNAAASIAADLGVGASNQQSNQQTTTPASTPQNPSSEKDDSEVVLAQEMALAIANNPDMTPEQFQELRSKIQNDVEQRGEAPSQIKMQRSSSSSPSKPSLEDQRKALREREAAKVRALEEARKEVARQKQQQFEEQQRKALEDDASNDTKITNEEEKEEEKNVIIAKNTTPDENPPVLISEKKEPPSTSPTKDIDNKEPTAATKEEEEKNPKENTAKDKLSSFSERMIESKAKAAARDLEIKQNEDVQSASNDVSSKIAAAKRKVEARKKKKLEKEAAKKKQLEKEAEKKKLEEEAEKRNLEKEAEKKKLEQEAEKKKLEKEAARAKEAERIANERQPLLNKIDDSTAKTYDSTEEEKAEIDSGATKRKTNTIIYWILAFVVVAVGYALMKADPNLVSSLKSIQLGDAFPSEIRTDVLEDGSSGKKKQRKLEKSEKKKQRK